MIEHIPELIEAGIDSFKVEGRMKSVYYVANVTNAYRRALDNLENPNFDLIAEVKKSSHRNYTTGFYFNEGERECLEQSMPVSTHDFVGVVLHNTQDDVTIVEQRNMFKVGDELEILSPTDNFNKIVKVLEIKDEEGNDVVEARKVQQKLFVKLGIKLNAGDILRKKI